MSTILISYSRQQIEAMLNDFMAREFGRACDKATSDEKAAWFRDYGMMHQFICEAFPVSMNAHKNEGLQ